jgi:hypothetical protein
MHDWLSAAGGLGMAWKLALGLLAVRFWIR